MEKQLEWKPIGEILEIEGIALTPGIYTGLDGIPTEYDAAFIENIAKNIVSKPIVKKTHNEGEPEKVGWITHFDLTPEKALKVRGYVFDIQTADDVRAGKLNSFSIESSAKTVGSENYQMAVAGDLPAITLTDKPACKPCTLTAFREVKKLSANPNPIPPVATAPPTSTAPVTKVLDDYLKEIVNAGPDREKFFAWIEEKLKGADIPADILAKISGILKAAIKTPYPYPAPSPKSESAYSDYIGKCVKGGKTMAECATEWGKEHKEEEDSVASLVNSIWLSNDNPFKATHETTELEALEAELKKLDPEYDRTKALEGIDTHLAKVAVLRKSLEAFKTVETKKVKLQAAGSPDATKAKIDKASMEVFGQTLEAVEKKLGEGGKS